MLSDLIESKRSRVPAAMFAEDLYELLDKKHLRGFLSFERLCLTSSLFFLIDCTTPTSIEDSTTSEQGDADAQYRLGLR
jgi:hypothetical protein